MLVLIMATYINTVLRTLAETHCAKDSCLDRGSKLPPQLPLEPAANTHEQLIRRTECLCSSWPLT